MKPKHTSTNIEELKTRVMALRKEIRELPFQSTVGKIKDVHKTTKIRREIARALTTIHGITYSHVNTTNR